MFCPGSGTKQAQPADRILALQAAFADILISRKTVRILNSQDQGKTAIGR